MAKKIILTFCFLFEAVLVLDLIMAIGATGRAGIIHTIGPGESDVLAFDFVLFTIANVVIGLGLLEIWRKPKSAKTTDDDAG